MSVTAYIALGSNLGDRQAYLDRAIQSLREQPGVAVTRVSSWHETVPVGGPAGQGNYLNGAAELQTDLEPIALLRVLLDIERDLGRVRLERNGPRTIDLDLLLYADRIVHEPGLVVPHPRLHERDFVLNPLAEVAPEARHPVLGQTIRELKAQLQPAPLAVASASPGELAPMRAMITGSTRGIGLAIAVELAAGGAHIIIHGRHWPAHPSILNQLQAHTRAWRILLADLSDPAEHARFIKSAWDQWAGLDIWINNAGADTLTGQAAHWPFEHKLQALLDVDVKATMLISRAVGERMQRHRGGVILNVGWDQTETGMEGDSGQLFGAAKGAVMAFTKSLALTLAPEVRVNCLAPGWIRTAWGESASEKWHERVRRETPLGRWGTPEDVARTARWLVSPAAAFITGQVIRVNGGAVR
jgi:2-amino-4-hydroxy-6-hydroxymethyldihydropteridine diphosphokinase